MKIKIHPSYATEETSPDLLYDILFALYWNRRLHLFIQDRRGRVVSFENKAYSIEDTAIAVWWYFVPVQLPDEIPFAYWCHRDIVIPQQCYPDILKNGPNSQCITDVITSYLTNK